ncbi:MAG: hypothetical protein Q8O52_30295 [Sulfuritalea sp.]|nr:hypothetical protein [Sulfuritalea sp.]
MRARAPTPTELVRRSRFDRQRRFGAEGGVETGLVGFFRHQLDQAQQALGRGIQRASFDNHRFGEVVSLEQMESQQVASFHLLLRFDVCRNQRAARGTKRPYQGLQVVFRKCVDIDLEPGGEIGQRPEAVACIGDAGEREGIAPGLEFMTAR